MKKVIRWMMRSIPRPLLIKLSLWFGFMIRPFFIGKKVYCPVCQHSFRKFLPYGINSRENVLCPVCLSLERHRLLWLWWNRLDNFFGTRLKILHVAPEQCFINRFKSQKEWDYTTADLESPMADLHFDLHQIPLDDNTYDWVICNHVLEHVDDDQKVLGEILRILRRGGRAILQVPLDYSRTETYENQSIADPAQREINFGQRDHLRLYGTDYPDRLRKAGFIVEEIDLFGQLPTADRERFRLSKHELIYLAIKP